MTHDYTSVSNVSEPFDGDRYALCNRTTGAQEKVLLDDVRGAVVPPDEGAPGYVLWIGEMRQGNDAGVRPLLMLDEYQDPSQDTLTKRVLDDVVRFRASTLYAYQPEIGLPAGFWGDLRKAMANRPGCKLKGAASVRDTSYGYNLARDAIKSEGLIRLEGDHVLRSQMRTIVKTGGDLDDPKYYAFHALRYLLAGFRRDRQQSRVRAAQSSRNAARRNPGGWT